MSGNMANIESLLAQGELANEENKTGMSKEDIKKLKLFTYGRTKKKGDEETCSICLVAAKKGDRVYQLVCKHVFH